VQLVNMFRCVVFVQWCWKSSPVWSASLGKTTSRWRWKSCSSPTSATSASTAEKIDGRTSCRNIFCRKILGLLLLH